MNYDHNSKSSHKKVNSNSKITTNKWDRNDIEFKFNAKNFIQRRKMNCPIKQSVEKVKEIETELLYPAIMKPPLQNKLFPKRKVSRRRSCIIKTTKEDIFINTHFVRCRSLRNIRDKIYKYDSK